MADVDMTDAPSGSTAPVKKTAGKAKAGAEGGADGKKRFEVKKASHLRCDFGAQANTSTVECSSSLGLGYRCRQLCYLQKPYHGSLYVFQPSWYLLSLTMNF